MKKYEYPIFQKTTGVASGKEDVPPDFKTRSFVLDKNVILPCPFCANDSPKLELKSQSFGEGIYPSSVDWYEVECECGASGEQFYVMPFRDFRSNSREEYKLYEEEQMLKAVKAWNIRKLDTDDI